MGEKLAETEVKAQDLSSKPLGSGACDLKTSPECSDNFKNECEAHYWQNAVTASLRSVSQASHKLAAASAPCQGLRCSKLSKRYGAIDS